MKIKFIPTGNIFDLPENECLKIYKEDRGNYEFLDKFSKTISSEIKNVSVDDLVVKDKTNDLQKQEEEKTEIKSDSETKTETDTEKAELIQKAKSLGIKGNLDNCKVETIKKKIAALEK